jgi:hypothetical protein
MSLFVASMHLILIRMSENGSWECPPKKGALFLPMGEPIIRPICP